MFIKILYDLRLFLSFSFIVLIEKFTNIVVIERSGILESFSLLYPFHSFVYLFY